MRVDNTFLDHHKEIISANRYSITCIPECLLICSTYNRTPKSIHVKCKKCTNFSQMSQNVLSSSTIQPFVRHYHTLDRISTRKMQKKYKICMYARKLLVFCVYIFLLLILISNNFFLLEILL